MENELEKYRKEIEIIDSQIFELFEKRFGVVKKVGDYKRKNNIPIRNIKREEELVDSMIKRYSMDRHFVSELYQIIFSNSYKIEK